MLYSSDLKRRKILSEKNSTEGEISGIFNRDNEVAAIYNKRSSEYSSAEVLIRVAPIFPSWYGSGKS